MASKMLKLMTNHSRIYDDSEDEHKPQRKEVIRKTVLNSQEDQEERSEPLTDLEKKLKVDPVDEPKSPFEEVPGLTKQLEDAKAEKLKKKGIEEDKIKLMLLSDHIMTKDNYKNMFRHLNMSDTSIIM